MHNQPSVEEILEAVHGFLSGPMREELSGHSAFHARVAANLVETALRDVRARANNEREEMQGLSDLLGADKDWSSLEDLRHELVGRIRDRTLTAADPALMRHLKSTAIRQLKVDQPRYSGLAEAENRTSE